MRIGAWASIARMPAPRSPGVASHFKRQVRQTGPMEESRGTALFRFVFVLAFLSALAWLLLGLLPALAAGSDAFHDWMHRQGDTSEIALNAAQASHTISSGAQVFLDYLFSAFNLAFAIVLMRLRPRDQTARLLAIGVIGSAVAFNLQGHDAFQVVPVGSLSFVDTWHVTVHLASGLCYALALITFPDGSVLRGSGFQRLFKIPAFFVVGIVLVLLSVISVDDHTVGLVVAFGLFIPVVGITSQVGRLRAADDEEERQRSRVLLWALATALVVAVPLMVATGVGSSSPPRETVEYEVKIAEPGTYYFRCDPHPDEMTGIVRVASGGSAPLVAISATESRFDRHSLQLPAGRKATIRFTNFDTDLHNVAIYRDPQMNQPLFVGREFSGKTLGVLAFRIFRIVLLVIPVALLIGLVRFRLWDVNRVVNRALVYGLIAGFISLAYLTVVIGLGAAFGLGTRPNIPLSLTVTVLVAATFQPIRDRARYLANRIVYGRRATPYELLSEFSDRVGTTPDLERVLPDLARLVAKGTGAASAEVWLRLGQHLVRAAAWPDDPTKDARAISLADGSAAEILGRDKVVEVRRGDELLGALTITKPPGDKILPVEERLLMDAAAQAGLALKNVQLTAELQARLADLRASRQRIVAAQDAERRRLERDIHDGAQQHLVALSMKLRRAQDLADSDPAAAQELMTELQTDTNDALQTLRDLARGIYPPVLSDRGLEAALEAHSRRTAVPISVISNGVKRYESNIETAVYFCCLEAIQNAIKHSDSERVIVELTGADAELRFSVRDDGRGFETASVESSGLENMADRLAAVAGSLDIDSTPGRGTTVTGRIPLI